MKVHALAFKFNTMYLDYIPRESNTIADALSREGSENMVEITKQTHHFYFKLESLMKNVKIK